MNICVSGQSTMTYIATIIILFCSLCYCQRLSAHSGWIASTGLACLYCLFVSNSRNVTRCQSLSLNTLSPFSFLFFKSHVTRQHFFLNPRVCKVVYWQSCFVFGTFLSVLPCLYLWAVGEGWTQAR